MLEYILPRHLQIIYEINALFLKVNMLALIFAGLKLYCVENLVQYTIHALLLYALASS